MENTTPLLFDKKDEKYFLAVKGRAVGPLTEQEVYEKIQSGEASILHFVWREGLKDWVCVADEAAFKVLLPQKPAAASIKQIEEAYRKKKKNASAVNTPEGRNLYLYANRTQYGPFSKNELEHVLVSHKVGANAFLWTPGWSNWKRLSELPEFAGLLKPPAPLEEESSIKLVRDKKTKTLERTIGAALATKAGVDSTDRRKAPRRPLVARLFLHNDKEVVIAVCRDISIGGMQVLTDHVPGEVGATVKLNVSPGDATRVKGFVAEGEIVRVLEDGRGFSFRFKKLSADAKKAIENYIRE